jgi:hypothetical protein
MQPYKFTYPQQNRICQRLITLVGPGAATFYKDACFLMEMDTPLESTTHLVGHLLREVESSLRDVLEALSEPVVSDKNTNLTKCPSCDHKFQYQKPLPSHKDEIHAILKALGVGNEKNVAQLWLRLAGKNSKYGLHSRAHRSDLAAPRTVDDEFKTFWRQIQIVLDGVLDGFEVCSALIREKLDVLLNKEKPDKQDIKFLRLNTPNSHFAIGYFFENLKHPEWLQPLRKEGFFNNPPGIEFGPEGKTFRIPIWSQSSYLIEVSDREPKIVLEISKQLFDLGSDNVRIYENLTKAALKMPSEYAAQFAEQVIPWIQKQSGLTYFMSDNLGKLIELLSCDSQENISIDLAKVILSVLPQLDDDSYIMPIFRLEEYQYGKLVQEYMSELFDKLPEKILTLFCELLDEILGLRYSIREDGFSEDHSYSWFNLWDDSSDHPREVKAILAKVIWEITNRILDKDESKAKTLLEKFQGYPRRVFDRMLLHILRRLPEQLSDSVIGRLLNRERLDWLGLDSDYPAELYVWEHAKLLQEQFPELPVDAQEKILHWFAEGPTDAAQVDEDRREEYIRLWQRDWFSIIGNNLPPHFEQLYTQLVQEVGEAISLDSALDSDQTSFRSGPDSPKSGEELAQMAEGDMDKLFTYLQNWQPSGRFSDASRNGLGWELAEQVIAPNPEKFVSQIEQFKELNPEYMIWMLRGLQKALDNSAESTFSWKPILNFCDWMLNDFRTNQMICFATDNGYSAWNQICDAIVDVVNGGLSARSVNRIPLNFRNQVWQIIEPLTSDPDVTPGFMQNYAGSNMSPYGDAINCVRSEAIRAVVNYANWARTDPDDNIQRSHNFDDMPEVQQVLEWHLNSEQDPSSAIRAVYGNQFPRLHYLASDWANQHVDGIFPEEPVSKYLFEAAWEGYLYNQLYTDIFHVLRGKYIYAMSLSQDSNKKSDTMRYFSKRILILFWENIIDLCESDNFLEIFFIKSSPPFREEFLHQVGWRLLYGEFNVDDELSQRLRKLLEWRVGGATKTLTDNEDLKYFSWIFASGKLDDQWSMNKLVDVLQSCKIVGYCEGFLERLSSLAPSMPLEAIQCLTYLSEGSMSDEWFLVYQGDHHRAIFRAALDSENSDARKSAKDLINRLVARTLGDYRDLLS